MQGDARGDFVDGLAETILGELPPVRALVAIDGIGASGKTTLLAELARSITARPTVVVHAADFFNSAEVRRARGRYSPEGFWLDTYDYAGLVAHVLAPLHARGPGIYRPGTFDRSSGRPHLADARQAAPDAVVLVEGTFLHRAELRAVWDCSIFLAVSFSEAGRRMARRAGAPLEPALLERYLGAQRIYFREAEPWLRARLVIDNTDPGHPRVVDPNVAPALDDLR